MSWYFRVFMREDGYFGRGGFTECMLTSASMLYAAALALSTYGNLPTAIDTIVWGGIPAWTLGMPALFFACLSTAGIASIGRLGISRELRTIGVIGQFACFFFAIGLGLYESGFRLSVVVALELPYMVAAFRTSILVRFRAWAA